MNGAAFYCASSELYFLGAVAMINSLRLQGHQEPAFVLDCGLSSEQRELLAPEATVIEGPGSDGASPWLLKTKAPLERPAEVAVLIDTDVILTRSLAPLIERAAEGRVVGFENDRQRYIPEWGELLGLGDARPGPYVTSGLLLLGGSVGRSTLELLDERQRKVEAERTVFGEAPDENYPFYFLEQDVLNAILRTHVDPDRLVALENRLAANPPFAGLDLYDVEALRCTFADGTEPYALHHFGRKPWIEPIYHGLFSRLLARLLIGPGLAIRVPEETVPLRLRNGARARLERARVDVRDVFRRYVLERRTG